MQQKQTCVKDKRILAIACELARRYSEAYEEGVYDPDANMWASADAYRRHMEWINVVCSRNGISRKDLSYVFVRLMNSWGGLSLCSTSSD